MGINLGNLESSTPVNSTRTNSSTPSNGISLNLQKNDFLDLTKRNPGLSKIKLCAGWDPANIGQPVDLDVAAFVLQNDKLRDGNHVIFFNNMNPLNDSIVLCSDDRTGASSTGGDDECIDIDLSKIESDVTKIIFTINIFNADTKRQTFGMVNNSYVRLLDVANGEKELCKYELKENFSTETAVVVAELIREGNEWTFHTIGEGKHADLNGLAALYQ